MNFRLIATEPRASRSGRIYAHIIWIGEFDGLQFEAEEAIEFVRNKLGPICQISTEEFPTIFH